MTNLTLLKDEIDALERLQAELAAIAKRTDDRRRNDLVALRRRLSAAIGKVGSVAEPILTRLGDPAILETYRSKYSTMRTAAATHQAKWPAVLLGERPEEYRESAAAVREANREFVAWMRETMAHLRDQGGAG